MGEFFKDLNTGKQTYQIYLDEFDRSLNSQDSLNQIRKTITDDLFKHFEKKLGNALLLDVSEEITKMLPKLVEKVGKDIVIKGLASMLKEELNAE